MLSPSDVTDGLSNTYLVGDRILGPSWYYGNSATHAAWDCSAAFSGFAFDNSADCGTLRTCPQHDTDSPDHMSGPWATFGSAHASGFGMAFCDGSAHLVSYSIDPETHRRLGNRNDRLPVEPGKF
jgi:hypothetical protein